MTSISQGIISLLVLVALCHGAASDPAARSRYELSRRAWYHSEDHPVHGLFKRDLVPPGSQQWAAQYPNVGRPPIPEALTPASWLKALQTAEQAGLIPNIPISTQSSPGTNPQYGQGQDPGGPEICSSTVQCKGADDHWDAPDGHLAIGFDDGPTTGSAMLYEFLQEQNQTATHFMIGINILSNYQLFNWAFSELQNDISVHTWTHPYMTTQNNTQVVAQLGWTLQIIHDSTGGRVPRFWRPPYGDSDNRVRAIAKEVFGLTQIQWNRDSSDWSIGLGGPTQSQVEESLSKWHGGPKSPGLIILEHELNNNTSGAFINTYATIKANNWVVMSTAQLFGEAYQNADDDDGDVQSMDVAGTIAAPSSSAPSSTSMMAAGQSASGVAPDDKNKNVDKASGARPMRMCRERASIPLLLLSALWSVFW